MRIDVRSRTVRIPQSLRAIIESRVTTSLATLSEPIDSVLVTIETEHDPRGLPAKRCRIEARGANVGGVGADGADVDAYSAMHAALGRFRNELHQASRRA